MLDFKFGLLKRTSCCYQSHLKKKKKKTVPFKSQTTCNYQGMLIQYLAVCCYCQRAVIQQMNNIENIEMVLRWNFWIHYLLPTNSYFLLVIYNLSYNSILMSTIFYVPILILNNRSVSFTIVFLNNYIFISYGNLYI